MARTAVASAIAAAAVVVAWLGLEAPPLVRPALVIAALGIVPALIRSRRGRALAVAGATLGAAWVAFGAQPWELAPLRDERVLAPALRDVGTGIVDFYDVFLPFVPVRNPEMHTLVLCAIFAFTLAASLLVAARRPVAAAAVTVAGVGWPATLADSNAIALGAIALSAALSIPLVLRVSSVRTLVAGTAIGALVVMGAASASSATTLGGKPALDWESWNLRGPGHEASSVRFIWDANYDGISFPSTKTEVLRVTGPDQPYYWRSTTLDLFTHDRWVEDPFWLGQVDGEARALQLPQLVPERAADERRWVEQHVRIEALVDDHLVAAGTPVGLDARRFGTIFQLSGGVLRVRDPIRVGQSYTVWSYAPDPAPRSLAAAPVHHPPAASRFLEIEGRVFPAFDAPNRDRLVHAFLRDPSYGDNAWQGTLYDVARRVAGDATTPYGAVLALESWFRQTGGFRYDESPPHVDGPPLVAFVTRTRAGYCQHFAGAMALMLRQLGVPSRVAVGFTSGTRQGNDWVVTDHDAHAWVEVWFPGQGWIPFDPTPGRGTLGGEYSFASGSAEAVAALRRGDLSGRAPRGAAPLPDTADILATTTGPSDQRAPMLIAVAILLAAVWFLVVGVGKELVRRSGYLTRDPRRLASASRRELEGFLRDQGAVVAPNATLADLRRAVRVELGIDCRPFMLAVSRARYGRPDAAQQSATAARAELRGLLRAARRELSVWARVRGFVSLRSLRSTVAR
jgi:transglutaminase-like putative cysteine protease